MLPFEVHNPLGTAVKHSDSVPSEKSEQNNE